MRKSLQKILQALNRTAEIFVMLAGTYGIMLILLAAFLLLAGCATTQPPSTPALCDILLPVIPAPDLDLDSPETVEQIFALQDKFAAACQIETGDE